MESNLNKEDEKKVEKLFEISYKIFNECYEALSRLQVQNKQNTKEYINAYNKLNSYKKEENKIYQTFECEPDKIEDILFYIYQYREYSIIDALEAVKNTQISEMVISRIGYRLSEIIKTTKFPEDEKIEDYEEFLPFEIDNNFVEKLFKDYPDAETIEKYFLFCSVLESQVEIDIINMILRILSDYIESLKYEKIKEKLIAFKFRLAFVFKFVEDELIKNNFEINKTLYWNSPLIASLKGDEGLEELNSIKHEDAEFILKEQIQSIIDLASTDLDELDNYAKAIIIQIILRGTLLFASSEEIQKIQKLLINDLKNLALNNAKINSIINQSFQNMDKDRGLVRVIKFKAN